MHRALAELFLVFLISCAVSACVFWAMGKMWFWGSKGFYEQLGDYKEAVACWMQNQTMAGREDRANGLKEAFKKFGYREFLKRQAEYREADDNYVGAAFDYAKLGDENTTFAALEKASENRSGILYIKSEPELDNVRLDPRFADLLRRMGLPQ